MSRCTPPWGGQVYGSDPASTNHAPGATRHRSRRATSYMPLPAGVLTAPGRDLDQGCQFKGMKYEVATDHVKVGRFCLSSAPSAACCSIGRDCESRQLTPSCGRGIALDDSLPTVRSVALMFVE